MNERGMLFTPENYTKTEQNLKTQTRRIVRWPTWTSEDDVLCLTGGGPMR
jgi:hypothetical protein